jgi:hypothetical protein
LQPRVGRFEKEKTQRRCLAFLFFCKYKKIETKKYGGEPTLKKKENEKEKKKKKDKRNRKKRQKNEVELC